MVLRLMTTKTVEETRHAFIVNAAGDALWTAGLAFVGLALFSYYQLHPAPADLPADRMLPYFMSEAFPAGAVGLVIAAILAASLSSIDSAVHSCSSVLMVDVYTRLVLGRQPGTAAAGQRADDRSDIFVLRAITVLVGIAGTTLACNVQGIGGLLEIWNKLINAFTGPLFGIFVLAMFVSRATSIAALAGGMAGAVVAYVVAYHSGIGFLWPSTFGFAATLALGGALTLISGRTLAEGESLTWRAVMRRPLPARAE
jgi:SSS family solute:Na+ symporter